MKELATGREAGLITVDVKNHGS